MRFENLLDIGYRIDIPITMYSILYTSIDRISSGNLLKSVIFVVLQKLIVHAGLPKPYHISDVIPHIITYKNAPIMPPINISGNGS